MKKPIVYVLGIALFTLTIVSCGSSKKGCGLTSDAQKIEQATEIQTTTVSSVS